MRLISKLLVPLLIVFALMGAASAGSVNDQVSYQTSDAPESTGEYITATNYTVQQTLKVNESILFYIGDNQLGKITGAEVGHVELYIPTYSNGIENGIIHFILEIVE